MGAPLLAGLSQGLARGVEEGYQLNFEQQKIKAQKQYWSALEKTQTAQAELDGLKFKQLQEEIRRQAEREKAIRKFLELGPEQDVPPDLMPQAPQGPGDPFSSPAPQPPVQIVPPPLGLKGSMLQQPGEPTGQAIPASMPGEAIPAGMPPSQPKSLRDNLVDRARVAEVYGLFGPEAALEVYKGMLSRHDKDRNPIVAAPGSTVLIPMPDGTFQERIISERPEKPVVVPEGGMVVNPVTGKTIAEGKPKADKEKRPITVGEGGTVVDPDTGKVIYQAPRKPEKPPDFGNDREAVADELYKKSYAELDQTQKAAVNKRIKEDKVDIAKAGAQERAGVVMDQPLPPEDANKLGVPYGTTRKEAMGLPVMTPQQREALAGYDTARTIINDIRQYSERVNTEAGGLQGRAKQAMKLWGAWTQSNQDAALLMSKAGELASVARSLGEKGALANQDVARAAALIPSVLDTQGAAQKKIQDMLAIIEKGEQNFRKSLGIAAREPVREGKPSVKGAIEALPEEAITVPKEVPPDQVEDYKRAYREQMRKMKQGVR